MPTSTKSADNVPYGSNMHVMVAGGLILPLVGVDNGDGTASLSTSGGGSSTVGGKTGTVSVTPTVSTSAYTAGYVVGGLLTFASALLTAQSGIIQSARISIKSAQTVGFKLYIFTANPSNTTWTDHAAPAINAADVFSIADVISLSAPDSGLGTHTIYAVDGIGKAVAASSTSLYGVLVTTGTPTFASTGDVSVSINVLQD